MKVVCWVVMILVVLPALCMGGERQNYSTACEFGNSPATKLVGTLGCVLVGAGVGLGAHEASHALLGGGDLHWSGANWKCPQCTAGRAQTIGLAGFTTQAVANEALLLFDVPREHPVVGGFMLWNILNPLAYVIRSELAGSEGTGDLATFHDSQQRRAVEGVLVGVALLQAARMTLDDRFPLFIQTTGRDVVAVLQFKF